MLNQMVCLWIRKISTIVKIVLPDSIEAIIIKIL